MSSSAAQVSAGYLASRPGINWRSLVGFELGWFALILFKNMAVIPVVVYWFYGMYKLPNRARIAVLLTMLAGIAIDSLLSWSNVISFSPSQLLPGWFLLVWALFALAAVETMAKFLQRWWLGFVLGASGGPLSYVGGAALSDGALQFPLAPWSYLILVAVWGVLGVGLGYSRRFYAQAVN